MKLSRRRLLIVMALAPLGFYAYADDDGDDDDDDDARRARRALLTGRALPLARILEVVRQRVPGEVVKVKLKTKHHRLVYEIKVLSRDGRLREVKLDARSAKVLEIEDDDD